MNKISEGKRDGKLEIKKKEMNEINEGRSNGKLGRKKERNE